MKVFPFKIPKPYDDGIIYQEDHEFVFYNQYHQHEEIQISLIKKGEGTLIVGDMVNDYKSGDIIVIGSHLPHVFKSDVHEGEKSIMQTLFFTKNAFGDTFFELEELDSLKLFFKRSESGFLVNSNHSKMYPFFEKLKGSSKFDRFIILLRLLQLLSRTKTKRLSSFAYNKEYSDTEGKRMRAVMDYTVQNFEQRITLYEIAQVASMTKNAFCKYFKKRTNKTYFQFLNELRIEQACKLLLQEKEISIIQISEQCGFNNLSNFNRQFKSIKGKNPTQFKAIR